MRVQKMELRMAQRPRMDARLEMEQLSAVFFVAGQKFERVS